MTDEGAAFAPPTPPAPEAPAPEQRPRNAARRGRPAFGAVVVVAIGLRAGRQVVESVASDHFGILGVIAIGALVIAAILVWRGGLRRRIRARGGTEFPTELVLDQIAASGVGGPAFPEDGTLLGASLLVVNQHSKVLEIQTTYDVFGSNGRPLGAIRQIGQSRGKQLARILTVFDQYFTHHFELLANDGRPVLRLTRPAKIFRSKIHVFDGDNRFLGTIRQQNIFWKINFQLVDWQGNVIGHLRADNVRAWDFQVYDSYERPVATVVKTWEGWARTVFTRADRYVVRIHTPLPEPLLQLTLATALSADVALKQDARGIS